MEVNKRAGILSFRLAGTDGVSLEAFKWAAVLGRLGYESHYFGGELQTPPERSFPCPLAHFRHPQVEEVTAACFGCDVRDATGHRPDPRAARPRSSAACTTF